MHMPLVIRRFGQLIEDHALPIVASCMLLAVVTVADNAFARWLNHKERSEMRADAVNSVELREVRKVCLTLLDRLDTLEEQLNDAPH